MVPPYHHQRIAKDQPFQVGYRQDNKSLLFSFTLSLSPPVQDKVSSKSIYLYKSDLGHPPLFQHTMAGLNTDTAILAGLAQSNHDRAVLGLTDGEVAIPSSKGAVDLADEKNTSDDMSASSTRNETEFNGENGNDHLHPDYPTLEQKAVLRRVPGPIAFPAYMIALVELAERFSYYGSVVVFTNFIQRKIPAGSTTGASYNGNIRSGALGLGQQASTGLTTFNSFWVYCTPLMGAFVADNYLGRYKTVCWAVAIALVGHTLLVISAIPSVISHPDGALACFVVAIIVMGVGTGGFKPNISPMVAEQMPQVMRVKTIAKTGEQVIVDPALTSSRVYMIFYLLINIGALTGQVAMVYAENFVGFWLAYLLPTLVFLLSPLVLFFGRKRYITSPPTGSVLQQAFRVFRYCAKGKWTSPRSLKSADFWDTARPSMIPAEQRPTWMTYNDAFVDELRRGLKACTVFLWYPLYWLTYNQINNNLTSQAAVMNTHGIPNDILSNLDPFALIILIPICDLFVYPALRKAGIRFTPIKKITAGFATGSLAMVCATIVQHSIYQKSQCGNYTGDLCEGQAFVEINVWAQTPSYVLIAMSEILASITGLEYAFTKAPKSMRSIVMSVYLFMTAISSAIGEAFVPVSADPLLVWNYGSMAVIAGLASIGFWFSFRHLDAAEDELNELPTGALAPTFTKQEVKHE